MILPRNGRIGLDFGSYVDVAAPGHFIYSTLRGGAYGYSSGASLAAPLVSGLAGLLYAHYPHYRDEEVTLAILSNSVDLGVPGSQRGEDLIQATIPGGPEKEVGISLARPIGHNVSEGDPEFVGVALVQPLLIDDSS